MEFDYGYKPVEETGFPLVALPMVPIEFESPSFGSFNYVCFIDSGADFCVFNSEVLEALELELTQGEKIKLEGIKKGSPMVGYFHEVNYKVRKIECKAKFVFAEEFNSDYGLLGRKGFFENFKIEIDERNQKTKLTPYAQTRTFTESIFWSSS